MQPPIYNPEVPIVVAHVCHDAMELMRPVLNQWFGDSHCPIAIDEVAGLGPPGDLMRSVTDSNGSWKKSVRCMSGVFDDRLAMGVPACLPPKTQLVTFVGDPLTIVVAEYKRRQQQKNFWYRGQQVEFSQQFPTLESFLKRYPDWLYSRLPQDLSLANLSHKLGQEFLFVGVLESLQKSVDHLAKIIGQPSVELTGIWGANRNTSAEKTLRKKFYAQHPRLKAIYDFACSSNTGFERLGFEYVGFETVVNDHASPTVSQHGNVTTGTLDLQHLSVD